MTQNSLSRLLTYRGIPVWRDIRVLQAVSQVVSAIIVVAFVAYAVMAGLRHRRQASKNLEEYFLAGRTLPGWKATSVRM